jgi:hypothetical protein
VIIEVGAPYFLRILGASYAANGTTLLRLVALALPFMAVNVLYVTFARLARRVRRVLTIQVCIAVIVLTFTVILLGPFGIAGVGIAFLIGQGVVSIVVFPSVRRQFLHPEMAPDYADGATLVARSTRTPTDSTASSTSSERVVSAVDTGTINDEASGLLTRAAMRRRLAFWRGAH